MKQIIAAWLNRYFANVEALVLLLLITLVAAGLYLLGSIAVPILIALVFAYVLQGVVQRLAQLGAPKCCLLYTSPSPRDATLSRMPSSA